MNTKSFKGIFFIFAIFFTFSCSTYPTFADTKVIYDQPVIANNTALSFSKPMLNIDGSNYFPMRELLNKLGVNDNNIFWDQEQKRVTFYGNSKIFIYTIDSNTVIENGSETTIKTKPIIHNGSTYLPIRPVAENLGYTVSYDSTTKTTTLNK